MIVLDTIRERKPRFSPWDVVRDFAGVLKKYGVRAVEGNRYGGEFVREPFRECGVEYRVAEKQKSELYRDLLPLLNSRRVEWLDHGRLITQLTQLERRTGRRGRDSIDHAPNSHDDVVNAVAGVVDLIAALHQGDEAVVVKPITVNSYNPEQPWLGDGYSSHDLLPVGWPM
jgi:hypothetical protein